MSDNSTFDPSSVDLDTADPAQIICYLNAGGNDYDGRLGARVSALFVVLVTATCTTLFPVVASRVRWLRIPLYVYLFARYFGAGVIIATAFIHLLDPAYEAIGPASCVGMTGGWAQYTWPPSIAMASVMFTFLLDFFAEWYVERRYRLPHTHEDNLESTITTGGHDATAESHRHLHSGDQDSNHETPADKGVLNLSNNSNDVVDAEKAEASALQQEKSFKEQFAAFLVLEFGVIFHSVIIGLNLGVVGEEFSTLYPVIVFHQAFEGLGIGARLSAIPFPPNASKFMKMVPYILCLAYGLTTPIAIAIGLGVRTTYNSGSFTAQVVSGLLDSISAGILLYTGLVELLARDFLFNPERSRDAFRVGFMLVCLFLGTALMALLGKWA